MLKNKEEFFDENSKLVPMYIYTDGLKCDQIKYQVTIETLDTKENNGHINNDYKPIYNTTMGCHFSERWKSIHHIFSSE